MTTNNHNLVVSSICKRKSDPMLGFCTRRLKKGGAVLIHRRTNTWFPFPNESSARIAGRKLRRLIDDQLDIEADLMSLINSAQAIIKAGQEG